MLESVESSDGESAFELNEQKFECLARPRFALLCSKYVLSRQLQPSQNARSTHKGVFVVRRYSRVGARHWAGTRSGATMPAEGRRGIYHFLPLDATSQCSFSYWTRETLPRTGSSDRGGLGNVGRRAWQLHRISGASQESDERCSLTSPRNPTRIVSRRVSRPSDYSE